MFREGGVACESAFTCLSTFVHVCLAMSVWGVPVYIFRYVVLFTYVGMPVSVCVCCSLSSCVCRCMSTLWDGLSACLCGWRERVRASSYPLPTLAVLTSLPVFNCPPLPPPPPLSFLPRKYKDAVARWDKASCRNCAGRQDQEAGTRLQTSYGTSNNPVPILYHSPQPALSHAPHPVLDRNRSWR